MLFHPNITGLQKFPCSYMKLVKTIEKKLFFYQYFTNCMNNISASNIECNLKRYISISIEYNFWVVEVTNYIHTDLLYTANWCIKKEINYILYRNKRKFGMETGFFNTEVKRWFIVKFFSLANFFLWISKNNSMSTQNLRFQNK